MIFRTEQAAGRGGQGGQGGRAGVLELPRGRVLTPAFMPVGTLAAVKAVAPDELRALGYDIVLANAFHLWLRPGTEVVSACGGLHNFSGWRGSILTDSGGFQVFSLSRIRRVGDDGVEFRAPHNGEARFLSPEECARIQRTLGSDIRMPLDECVPGGAARDEAARAMRRSMEWALRAKRTDAEYPEHGALFGIMQGGTFPDLRRESAEALREMNFPGYAVGGLAVGEEKEKTLETAAHALELLPEDAPRYLMGIGTPADIARMVQMGADMFDCVLPARNGRNGQLFTSAGVVNVRNAAARTDAGPPDPECDCPVCRRFSRAFLRHLFAVGESLAGRYATLHNLAFYRRMMRDLRRGIQNGNLSEVVARITAAYPDKN